MFCVNLVMRIKWEEVTATEEGMEWKVLAAIRILKGIEMFSSGREWNGKINKLIKNSKKNKNLEKIVFEGRNFTKIQI